MGTFHIIHTRVLLMAITVHDGLWAGYSSEPARGITATTDLDMVITDAVDMATTVAATTDLAPMRTTAVAGLVTPILMHAGQLAEVSTVADAAERLEFLC
jgi:hypothetical protein